MLFRSINEKLHEFYNIMSEASRIWADQTGGHGIFVWTQNATPNIDVSNFKEQYNGIRGINMKNVPELLNVLTSVIDKTRDDMRQVREFTQRIPFLGGDQQNKLVELIEIMTLDITDFVTHFVDETKMAIQDTLNKYGDTASLVSGKLSDASK